MSSTRDPILLLEPSNLLEPLNLADRSDAPASALARPERPDTSSKRFMRPSKSTTAPIDRDRRWRLKSALIVAGALACFAAGTALPQLPELLCAIAAPPDNSKAASIAADVTFIVISLSP